MDTNGEELTASERRAAERRRRDEAGEPRSMTGMWIKTAIGIVLALLAVIVIVSLQSPAEPPYRITGDGPYIAVVTLWPNPDVKLSEIVDSAARFGTTTQVEVRCQSETGALMASVDVAANGQQDVDQPLKAFCP